MMTPDQVRAAMAGGMQWNTPSGATSLPGYNFQPVPAPPPPTVAPSQFMPSTEAPQGYAEMFQSPMVQQALAGMLQAMGGAPGGGPQGGAELSPTPEVSGAAPAAPVTASTTLAPIPPGQVPMPRARPEIAPTPMPGRPGTLPRPGAPTPMPGRPAILHDQTVKKLTEKTHTIKKGDTLWDIAKANGTTVQAIVKKNRIKNPNNVPIGRTLKL
jgi:hypothetical protein